MAGIKKYQINLNDQERQGLEDFVSHGKKSAREINRARILLMADDGKKDREIVEATGVTRQTVYATRKKYCESEHEHILDFLRDQPRTGRPIKFDSRVDANVAMIACTDAPGGRAKWTLRLIADKLVKLEIVESISHVRVGEALKKTNSNPGSPNNGA